MIQALIGAFILVGIYKFIGNENEDKVDWKMGFVFIFAPAILGLLINIFLGLLELNPYFGLIHYAFYFLVPFYMLKVGFEYDTETALKYSAVVPVVAIITEIIFVVLIMALSSS